jgi:dihydroflavonol-4-reductase
MAAGRRVLVTGGTGFIGSRLVKQLLARGDNVRCYVRATSDTSALRTQGVEVVTGELLDADALRAALEGCDVAFHLAAIYDIGVVDERAMWRANVEGTQSFLAAARGAGTARVVYVSTTVALGPVAAGEGDETTVHGSTYRSVYERTKAEAHSIAVHAQRDGLPLIIVCPANVYGPGDQGPNGRFVADLLHYRLPGLPLDPAWFSYVHVDDVVAGLLLAAEAGVVGETYILSGENVPLNDFAKRVAKLAGKHAPFLRFPALLTRGTGMLLDALGRLTGVRFPISRENAETASGLRWLHSHAKATRELGWTPRSLDEGLPDMVAEFRSNAAR